VAEETNGQETGAEASGIGVDPAAAALALGGASREDAAAFLKKQGALIDDQRHHLNDQFKYQIRQLRLGTWEKQLGVLLRVSTAFMGLAIALGLIAATWNASRADGMVVDAFSVPPSFAQDGVTGEVVADDLTARIGAVRTIAVNNSLTGSKDVRKDSAEDIKVEIPETGVSLGQAWRYLRLWLGHERHLNGNLRMTGGGKIALTVALDGERVVSLGGADLDKLEQEAAEQIFAKVDPTNIVIYLLAEGRDGEALAAAARATQLADEAAARANAYSLWSGTTREVAGDMKLALSRARIAADINPKLMTARLQMMAAFVLMGRDEEALRQAQAMRDFKEQDQPGAQQGRGFAEILTNGEAIRDASLGSFALAASKDLCPGCSQSRKFATQAESAARAHDGAQSRALVAKAVAAGLTAGVPGRQDIARADYFSQIDLEDWRAAVGSAHNYETDIKSDPRMSQGLKAVRLHIQAAPILAYALARAGDPAGAQAAIELTPPDCYQCILTRGSIAAAAKQWGRADWWFARAVTSGPSLPFAYADWGQALLDRDEPDAAIAKFAIASQKAPQFADPLEMWGEALMKKNRSDLALAKFGEAGKYAPNWGHLHLKWGEALGYAGKRDEAKTQFALAAGLDLSAADKSELAKVNIPRS
jgi:tetratricopeptide (TPR) repeat protein